MAKRYKKASRKYLGSRSWGAGNIKNRRGKGSKGGKGYANRKNKWTYIVKYEPDHFGRSGFVSPTTKRIKTINLWNINNLIVAGKIEKGSDGKFLADLKGYKVLGGGKLDFPVLVKANSFSKNAVQKIKDVGGEAKLEG